MRFSIWIDPSRTWSEAKEMAQQCEALGYDGLYVADHFMDNLPVGEPTSTPYLEATAELAALAAVTSTIELGTLVASATYRHPAVMANWAATLDQLSGGRAVLGLGAGWQENEHNYYGIELGSISERVDRFGEYVEVVSSLLRNPSTTFDGEYYQLHDAPCDPHPVQSPLPILLGVKGTKRTMAIAAKFADRWNAWTSVDDFIGLSAVLDQHCENVNRDPLSILRTTQAFTFLSTDEARLEKHRGGAPGRPVIVGTPNEVVEQIAQYRDAGCAELIIPGFTLGGYGQALETIQLFAEEVAPHLK